MSGRTKDSVQQPQETKWVWEYDVGKEAAHEAGRQKGFRQSKPIQELSMGKENKVRQETDPFYQWDQPREER